MNCLLQEVSPRVSLRKADLEAQCSMRSEHYSNFCSTCCEFADDSKCIENGRTQLTQTLYMYRLVGICFHKPQP